MAHEEDSDRSAFSEELTAISYAYDALDVKQLIDADLADSLSTRIYLLIGDVLPNCTLVKDSHVTGLTNAEVQQQIVEIGRAHVWTPVTL